MVTVLGVPLRRRWIFSAVFLVACTGLAYGVLPRRRASYGSNTNASDAVDAPMIEPDDTPEDVLDVAVEYTFPASDPIAIVDAYRDRERKEAPLTSSRLRSTFQLQ